MVIAPPTSKERNLNLNGCNLSHVLDLSRGDHHVNVAFDSPNECSLFAYHKPVREIGVVELIGLWTPLTSSLSLFAYHKPVCELLELYMWTPT